MERRKVSLGAKKEEGKHQLHNDPSQKKASILKKHCQEQDRKTKIIGKKIIQEENFLYREGADCDNQQTSSVVQGGGSQMKENGQKPLKASWIFNEDDLLSLKFKPSLPIINQQPEEEKQLEIGERRTMGKLGISQCPGKNLEMGRDGKKHQRDIVQDIKYFSEQGVTLIVCLLNESEMRSIGVNVKQYSSVCSQLGVRLLQYPIIEMAPPTDLPQFHSSVLVPLLQTLSKQENALVHCRGGVGRAGLVACCVLASLCQWSDHRKIIEFVRKRRDKRCVESRKQEDFVLNYFEYSR